MLVSAASRILRSALLCSLTILSLVTFAHATMPAALGTAIRLDDIGKIIGIIGGGGLIGLIGGTARFVYRRLLRRWREIKSELIEEAVKQADSQWRGIKPNWIKEAVEQAVEQADFQRREALCELNKNIRTAWESTSAGTSDEEKQTAAAVRAALLSLHQVLTDVLLGIYMASGLVPVEEQKRISEERKKELRLFTKTS
jgi:hypothetical protein